MGKGQVERHMADIVLSNNTVTIIERVKTIVLFGTENLFGTKRFVAAEHFVVDVSPRAKVKISHLGEGFRGRFLRKIEDEEIVDAELVLSRPLSYVFDLEIVSCLGGEERAEIALSQFFAVFAGQPKGEKGTLLTNGSANVGYVRDEDGVLCSVSGYWTGGGWAFEAFPLGHPSVLGRDGYQFLSH